MRGAGPLDFTELVLESCAHLLALSDLDVDEVEGRTLAERAIADGSASCPGSVGSRQGGDPSEEALRRTGHPSGTLLATAPCLGSGHQDRPRGDAPSEQGGWRRTMRSTTPRVSCHRKRGDAVQKERRAGRRYTPVMSRPLRQPSTRCSLRTRSAMRLRRAPPRPRRPDLMAFVVRRERPEDEREISEVVAAAFRDASVADFHGVDPRVGGLRLRADVRRRRRGRSHRGLRDAELRRPRRRAGRQAANAHLVAVRPDRQRQEFGAAVVRAAVSAADERGEPLVLVEGIPAYYPRFGFMSATGLGLERPDERIPDQAWLALPLSAYDPSIRGRVVYPSFFPGPPGA